MRQKKKKKVSSQHSTDDRCRPGSQQIPGTSSHTQFEVSVQDPSAVEVLEARDDLPQVISHFRLRQCVSRFPDVCQGLQGAKREPSRFSPHDRLEIRRRWMPSGCQVVLQSHVQTVLHPPYDCRVQEICRCSLGLQSDERISPHTCVTGFCGARSHW